MLPASWRDTEEAQEYGGAGALRTLGKAANVLPRLSAPGLQESWLSEAGRRELRSGNELI